MKLTVVLHDVRSVHNVGSIFRTADAAGVEKIYCCGITPAPLDRFKNVRQDFAKVSLGAEASVAWEHSASTIEIIKKLEKEGCKIFAVEQAKRSVSYDEALVGPQDHIVLVMGHEVTGLPPEILDEADQILEIPMFGKKESLNVAVAFGIVAFGLMLQSKKWRATKK